MRVAQIPELYKPIYENKHLYYIFYGGRGAGKTENVAQLLVLMAAQTKYRILCIRESQNSIAESVKATIEKWIEVLRLETFYTITNNSIVSKCGSEFLFLGMRTHTAVNVKSISNIDITWVEEAESFSKHSWNLLVPSVIRTKNPRIIVTFNPRNSDDAIYADMILNKPPDNAYIRKVNYDENPFFPGSMLETQMLSDKDRLPETEYRHKWLGELVTYSEDSLFIKANITPLNQPFVASNYLKIVVACDPATTNKDYSNEYGIIVLGLLESNIVHIIADISGNYSPLEFASEVSTAYQAYSASSVVVEVNNGGDFIKSTLLQVNPHLIIREVRASQDKVMRALPVASLMSISQVRLLTDLPKLTRQMRLLTHKGYMGSRGESPDRLDAMVWGVYDILGLRDRDSIWQLFSKDFFDEPIDYVSKSYIARAGITYAYFDGELYNYIQVNLHKNSLDLRFNIVASGSVDKFEQVPGEEVYLNLSPATVNQSSLVYTASKSKIDELVVEVFPLFKNNLVWLSQTNNSSLYLELMEFSYNNKDRKFNLLRTLCEMIRVEFN